ncbi:MAG: N-acetyltransferase [Rhodobiaceae bacterium]|jgi:predicted N-acetyltransferase YhbS|nr:N-acetyltransferase [Rhodobiaceae bacterium]MDB4831866.1 N-acetyltransferase [Hyphomicrobiales bacterium]MDC3272322.1 N-acetyltransferase [Hyphomicrobiales bacterium]|tara:strand:+ start:873 stop:1397 length:525 start_codon:yes stop_codon:yes gene_type:complete
MNNYNNLTIKREEKKEDPLIRDLLSSAFGPGRFAKTAYRLRENALHYTNLSFVCYKDNLLIGSVRYWPILSDDDKELLLLGPVAIHPSCRGHGIGYKLINESINHCRDNGHSVVILVGDLAYYSKLNFSIVPRGQIKFPGPVDPQRILYNDFGTGEFNKIIGNLRPYVKKIVDL